MSEPVVEAHLRLPLQLGSEFNTKAKAHLAIELLSNEQNGTRACVRHETSKPLRIVSICNLAYNKKNALADARAALRRVERMECPAPDALIDAQDSVAAAEAECGVLCPFRVVMTRRIESRPYRCIKLNSEHPCTQVVQPKYHGFSRRALMDQIVGALHTNQDGVHRSRAIADTVSRHLRYIPPVHTTQRARARRRMARVEDQNTQWQQLSHYLQLLREADPQGVAEKEGFSVIVSPSTAPEVARRCKPVVAIDACHAQGQHRLTIFLACALDGNNHLNVLAWGLAETESEETWTWFLSRLRDHIPLLNDHDRVIVSDRQKGLLNASENELPLAKHSYCCQHLASNVRKRFKSDEKAEFFKDLVHADTQGDFMRIWSEGQQAYSSDLFEYIQSFGSFANWACAFFGWPGRFGTTTSNAVEAANNWIGELREKPVVHLLHGLRDKVLAHAVKQKRRAEAETEVITSRALEIVKDQLSASEKYLETVLVSAYAPHVLGRVTGPNSGVERVVRVYALGDDGFEAGSVAEHTRALGCECSCRFYEEHRILCRHAMAVLITAEFGRPDLERMVAPFYTTAGWRATYQEIMPLHALPQELEVDEDEPLPKLRGSNKGRKKMKRWLPGQVATPASQADREQN